MPAMQVIPSTTLHRQHSMKAIFSGYPGEKFAIDLQGLFPESSWHRYNSKFGFCVALSNKEARIEHVCLIYTVYLLIIAKT